MAQIIPFPGVALAVQPAPAPEPAPKPPTFSTVSPIRSWRRVPKRNRPDDDLTIMFARLAKSWAEKAAKLAKTEPNSDDHRMALHMAGISHKLPRNNLRIFTTPEDVILGTWQLWRRLKAANLEWELYGARLSIAVDDDETAQWARAQEAADKTRWTLYERLVRLPAASLSEVSNFKLDKRLPGGMGDIQWMRKHKPDFAAVIDEEVERLTAEKVAKKAARAAKRGA